MTTQKPLRLWPGVVIAIVQLLVMIGAPLLAPDDGALIGMLGGVVGALLIAMWWLLFSRARWSERVGAIVLMVVAVFATRSVAHTSMVGAGQGMMLFFLPTPYLALALVTWAAAARHLHDGVRRAALVAAILIACAPFALIRTAGIRGGAGGEFHWRWTPTPEQRLLARGGDEPKPLPAPAASATSTASAAEMPKGTPPDKAGVTPTAPADSRRQEDRTHRARPPSIRRPSGQAFAGPCATASFAACGSRRTGPSLRRSRFGGGRLGQDGHRSRSTAISSIPRSSEATTKSCPVTA